MVDNHNKGDSSPSSRGNERRYAALSFYIWASFDGSESVAIDESVGVEQLQKIKDEYFQKLDNSANDAVRQAFNVNDPATNTDLLLKNAIIARDPRALTCLRQELDILERLLDPFNDHLKSLGGDERQDFATHFEKLMARYEGMTFPNPEDAREISARLQRICKSKLGRRFESWKTGSPSDMVFHGVKGKYGYLAVRDDDGKLCTTATMRQFKTSPIDDEVEHEIDFSSVGLEHSVRAPKSALDDAA